MKDTFIRKSILKIVCVFFVLTPAKSQFVDSIPPYQKDSTIPAFSILLTDSTWFNYEALPDNKPVIIIYFSPECGHCKETAQEFEKKIDKFKNVFIVWVSYLSVPQIKDFAVKYNMLQFENIKIGRDPKYYVPSFYRVKFNPFIAVYNEKGKLLATYEGGIDTGTLIRLLDLEK